MNASQITVDKLVSPAKLGMTYIRERIDNKHVEELATELRKIGQDQGWMFPPLDVMSLPPADKCQAWATTYGADPAVVARKVKQGYTAVVLDGVHRATAADQANWKKAIPVTVHTPRSGGEMMLIQFTGNVTGGSKLGLSMQARHDAIRLMVNTYKVSLGTIAKAVGMSKSSISRIMRGVQAKPAGTPSKRGGDRRSKQAKAKATRNKTKADTKPEPWKVGSFLSSLRALTIEANDHKEEIVSWLGSNGHGTPHVPILKTLAVLVARFNEAATK